MPKTFNLFMRSNVALQSVSCALLVILADFLFYGHTIGWTLGLFGAAVLLFSALHNYKKIRDHSLPIIALISAVVLVAALIEAPDFYVFVLFFLTTAAFAFFIRRPQTDDFRHLLKGVFAIFLLREARNLLKICLYRYKRKTHGSPKSFVRHWLMPCSMAALFIVLFAEANPVLTLWFSSIDWDDLLKYLSPLRMAFWLMTALLCWAILRPDIKSRAIREKAAVLVSSSGLIPVLFNERSIRIALLIFNALFALQNTMDIAVLWSGAALPQGITYAAYAHQGAYPLVVTAMLAAVFVLIALRPGSPTEQMPAVRVLVYAWVVQNLFLVASCIIRLCGYINEFSLTFLRIWALIWMALVGLGLIIIVSRIYLAKTNLWLINANGIALYGTLCICCFINFGGIVATYNVHHCKEVRGTGANLDFVYLDDLGVAALPALEWFKDNYKVPVGPLNCHCSTSDEISDLRQELSNSMSDWRRWSFRNYRINRELESHGDGVSVDH